MNDYAPEERIGGRLTFFGFAMAALLIIVGGAAQADGAVQPAVWITAGSFIAVGAVIAIGIGCYNLGRERGR